MARRSFLVMAVFCGFAFSTASAHYLWIFVDRSNNKDGQIQLVFEEGPVFGDGKYLPPFIKNGKTWVRTLESEKPTPLKLKEMKAKKKRWLTAPLSVKSPFSLTSYGKFGVYAYGKTNVLLHYNAQFIDAGNANQVKTLGRSTNLTLDIVPRLSGGRIELLVLWQGKPAGNLPVKVRGPNRFRKTVRTNKSGSVSIPLTQLGRHTFHTFIELNKSGKDDGKAYTKIRHHSTLVIAPPPTVRDQ